MSDETAIARATFTPITRKGEAIKVHFNPASLQYQVTNSLKEEGHGKDKKQFVTQSTAKLTMDLVFDTTLTGEDVRATTEKLVKFMEPIGGATGGGKKAAAVVEFRWGGYVFKGMVESYKETIDFFSAEGVPLRATVNLGLAQQDRTFEPRKSTTQDSLQNKLDPVVVPAGPRRDPGSGGGGQDTTQLAARAGDARAGRVIAAANGEESMRFSAAAALTVSPSIALAPPVAFASGGAGVGIGGGASVAFGGRASAGVSASAGAFAGLRAASAPRATLDVERLVARAETVSLGVDETSTVAVGGQVALQGSSSLSADVGASVSLRSRIQFEEE